MDHYQLLKISKDSSPDDIKKAFRKLALEFHPDVNKNPGSLDTFKNITEAYKILIDPKKRSEYDLKFIINEKNRKRREGWTIVHVEQEYKPYYPSEPKDASDEDIRKRKPKPPQSPLDIKANPPKSQAQLNHEEQLKIYRELLIKLKRETEMYEKDSDKFKVFDVEIEEGAKVYKNHLNSKPVVHPHNASRNINNKKTETKPKLSFSDLPKDNTRIR